MQEVFDHLAEAECALFYLSLRNREDELLQKSHAAAKLALQLFAKAAGCHNK